MFARIFTGCNRCCWLCLCARVGHAFSGKYNSSELSRQIWLGPGRKKNATGTTLVTTCTVHIRKCVTYTLHTLVCIIIRSSVCRYCMNGMLTANKVSACAGTWSLLNYLDINLLELLNTRMLVVLSRAPWNWGGFFWEHSPCASSHGFRS